MSILMMSRVWAIEYLEPSEKLVLLAIADFADDHGNAWPSIPTLARKSSLSEDTVRRKVRKLSTDGILDMSPRKDQTGRDTSYKFKLFPKTSPDFSLFKGSTMQPSPLHGARVEGSTVQPSFLKHHIEPSGETYSDFFEMLWQDYPVKDGKKKAIAHFRATVKTEADCRRIRKALDNYLAHLRIETWKKAKNGSTWFANWTDWKDEKPNAAPLPAEPRRLQVAL